MKMLHDSLFIWPFYPEFAFYDSNAYYPAQRAQNIQPATDLKYTVLMIKFEQFSSSL